MERSPCSGFPTAGRDVPFNVGGPCTGRLAVQNGTARERLLESGAQSETSTLIRLAIDICKRCSISGDELLRIFCFCFLASQKDVHSRCTQATRVISRRGKDGRTGP